MRVVGRAGDVLCLIAAGGFLVLLAALPVALVITGVSLIVGTPLDVPPESARVLTGVVILWVACLVTGLGLAEIADLEA